jgi:uncharacterized membrane protein YkvA (DUF1232 family)
MSRNEPVQFGGIMSLLNLHHTARMFWALQMDGRVSPLLKIQAWCGLVYFLSPLDFLPDYFTGVGLLDDIILCLILMQSFVELSPRHAVDQQAMRLGIDLDKVFVSVPQTVREARTIYDWARDFFSDAQEMGPVAAAQRASGLDEEEEEDEDAVSAEPPRHQRYSAYRPEE